MYVASPKEAKGFVATLKRGARSFAGVEAWVAPSFTLLPGLAAATKGSSIKIGAQTVSAYTDGPRTGEVSAAMLKEAGASFAIVGHSERRARGDTDGLVKEQLLHVVKEKLTAVLCVGEEERTPEGAHFAFIEKQLSILKDAKPFTARIVVAYEPVWAIGKTAGESMPPQELQETVIYIKRVLADIVGRATALKMPILYGGSVEPENAAALVEEGGVNGFLVGHASAKIDAFVEILKSCRQ